MGELTGVVALVTGGSVGIGRAISKSLASEGADVIFTYMSHSPEQTRRDIEILGGQVESMQVDVTNEETVNNAISEIEQRWGAISILINNAGGLVERIPLLSMESSHWNRVMELNLTSAFYCSRAVGASMPNGGRIVNISSLAGYNGGSAGSGVYAAAKAGMFGLTRALAKELAPRQITVNAVAPGLILDTPFHETFTPLVTQQETIKAIPLGRGGEPPDVASAVAWLVSPSAGWITGEILNINGGQYFL